MQRLPHMRGGVSFSIAGKASLDQLQAVLDSLEEAMNKGKTFHEWKKDVRIQDLGLPKHRLDNIFRTNIQAAYQRGHWEKFVENKKSRPYLMYDAINDSRVRPSHLAMDGIIRPIDDPFWATHYPPNGFRCRCRCISLSERQAQERSKNGTGLNKPITAEMQPDKGWDYNVGADLTAGIDEAIAESKANPMLKSELKTKLEQTTNMSDFFTPRTKWNNDFPKVVLNSPLGDAKKHPDYLAAKSGDTYAAVRLVNNLLSNETVEKISDLIGDKKPILIPVHAEEAVSINKIPSVFAIAVGKKLNLPVELTIVQAAKVSRTQSDGFGRLAISPPFAGIPSQDARHAIIFDDTLTQGGTLANLRGYVAQFGIETIAATTLTGKNYSSVLAITAATLEELKGKYHELEQWWELYFGYGFECLTESEARYIIKSGTDADTIRNRIIAERQKRNY